MLAVEFIDHLSAVKNVCGTYCKPIKRIAI